MPVLPVVMPWIDRLRILTMSVAAAETLTSATIDRDRLRDRDGAEPAGVEAIDLAAGGGLGNRAGKGLARRHPAAGVRIVADTRYPGPRSLSLPRRARSNGTSSIPKNTIRMLAFSWSSLLFGLKLAPGSAWNSGIRVGSLTQSCAQATRPRRASTALLG